MKTTHLKNHETEQLPIMGYVVSPVRDAWTGRTDGSGERLTKQNTIKQTREAKAY